MEVAKYFELKLLDKYTMKYKDIYISLMFIGFRGQACKFRIIGRNNKMGEIAYLPKAVIRIISESYLQQQDWFWDKLSNKHKLTLAGLL